MSNILTDLANGAKRLQKFSKEMSELELREEILALRTLLVDAQQAVLEKDAELSSLQEKLSARSKTIELDGFAYATDDEGKPKGLPFCPACLAEDGTLIHPADVTGGMYLCPKCRAAYSEPTNYK